MLARRAETRSTNLRASAAEPSVADVWIAKHEDIPALMALKAAVVVDSYSALGTQRQRDEWLARFCSRAYFEERMGPDAIFVGVGPRDHPLGMGALKVRDGKAYFGDLYCRQQRNGLGGRMFEFLADLARRRGLEFGVCDVFSTNVGGLRFVARLGFAPCSSYEEPSFKVDVIRLERPL